MQHEETVLSVLSIPFEPGRVVPANLPVHTGGQPVVVGPNIRENQGVAVFLHGRGQQASWQGEVGKAAYWDLMMYNGYACLAIKSPGLEWSLDSPEDGDYVESLVGAVRRRLDLTAAPTLYFGFSMGTGAASLLAFRDPDCRAVALFCGRGAIKHGSLNPRPDLKVHLAYNTKDPKVEIGNMVAAEAEWRLAHPTGLTVSVDPNGRHAVTDHHLPDIVGAFGLQARTLPLRGAA